MNTASCSWTEFPHKRNRVERGVLLCGLGMKHDGIKEIIGARLADSQSKSSRSHRMENSRSEMSGARVPTFLFPLKLRTIRVPHPHLYIRAWQRFIMRPQWTRKPTQSKSCARIGSRGESWLCRAPRSTAGRRRCIPAVRFLPGFACPSS